ncbi:MAG: NTP transferase domain-containing protein [Flavobacteriales bacterium]|nr:NTP transferase domain-containing protein [Flavobacteriales bacterium]
MAKHRKHTKLNLREMQNYAFYEIAILGVKCSIIADFSSNIAKMLQKMTKIGYLDASHNFDDMPPFLDTFTFSDNGILNLSAATTLNKFNARIQFSAYDLLLINGNHYQGNQQIIILDNDKEASILKRIDQITDIKFLIKLQDNSKIFDCLKDKFSEINSLPIYNITDTENIANHIEALTNANIPALNGLVLAGGKSLRMGKDKGLLAYHGEAQRDYLLKQMKGVLGGNTEIFLSVRAEQNIDTVPVITDKFIGLGPFGAICSAFMHNPNKAYLVVATDLPFVNQEVLELLISKRNPKKIATAIKGKDKPFMEPLITIWEPKAYPVLLSYLAQGYSCPRKVLINSDVEIVEIDDAFIQNINTPDEFEAVKKEIGK